MNKDLDPSVEILLAEHSRLVQLYLYTREIGERRINLYLTLATAVLGAVVTLYQFRPSDRVFLEVAGVGSLALFVLGALTFDRLLHRSTQGTEYLRALNRVHRYFTDRDPILERYLFWPPADELPPFRRGAGSREIREVVGILNGMFAGASLAVLLVLLVDGLSAEWALLAGAVLGLCVERLHLPLEARHMRAHERGTSDKVRFPVGSLSGTEPQSHSQPAPAALSNSHPPTVEELPHELP